MLLIRDEEGPVYDVSQRSTRALKKKRESRILNFESSRKFIFAIFVLLPWKIDDFVDKVGGKNGTADYADFLGLVFSVLTGRNR